MREVSNPSAMLKLGTCITTLACHGLKTKGCAVSHEVSYQYTFLVLEIFCHAQIFGTCWCASGLQSLFDANEMTDSAIDVLVVCWVTVECSHAVLVPVSSCRMLLWLVFVEARTDSHFEDLMTCCCLFCLSLCVAVHVVAICALRCVCVCVCKAGETFGGPLAVSTCF